MDEYHNFIEVAFIEEIEPLRIFKLSNFLYHLKIFYSWLASSEEFQKYEEKRSPKEIVKYAKNITKIILQRRRKIPYPFYPYQRHNFFSKDLKERGIFKEKANKENSLSMWFMGISIVLVVAFIICGGKIEINAVLS